MTETEKTIVELLHKNLRLKRPVAEIDATTEIFGKGGLGLDSVDVLEIAVLLDKHFGVRMEDQDPRTRTALANIGALAAFVDDKKRGA